MGFFYWTQATRIHRGNHSIEQMSELKGFKTVVNWLESHGFAQLNTKTVYLDIKYRMVLYSENFRVLTMNSIYGFLCDVGYTLFSVEEFLHYIVIVIAFVIFNKRCRFFGMGVGSDTRYKLYTCKHTEPNTHSQIANHCWVMVGVVDNMSLLACWRWPYIGPTSKFH